MTSDLHNLTAYLKEPRQESKSIPHAVASRFWGLLAALPTILLVLLAISFLQGAGTWIFFVFIFGGGGIFASLKQWARERSKAAAWAGSGLSRVHHEVGEFFFDLIENNHLEERIHPAVAVPLEVCASVTMEIRHMLADPKRLPELRRETLRALDEEMHDAMLEAKSWIRAKGMQRKLFNERIESNPEPPQAALLQKRAERLENLRNDLAASVGLPARGVERIMADLRERRAAEEELREQL
ncbi:hypothetical protein BH11ARM2_BH11ARM2_23990 [soil metagenome]